MIFFPHGLVNLLHAIASSNLTFVDLTATLPIPSCHIALEALKHSQTLQVLILDQNEISILGITAITGTCARFVGLLLLSLAISV